MGYDVWFETANQSRKILSKVLSTSQDLSAHISLNSSTSEVISAAANGINLSMDDHVAFVEGEYPSDVIVWMLRAERNLCKIDFYPRQSLKDPVQFVKNLHPRTKVLNLSHVSFQTGSMIALEPIGEELQKRGIFFIVDVTQSLGGMAVTSNELKHIDVLACSTYKWMLSPYGQAFGYWSDRALKEVSHTHASWLTLPHAPMRLTEYTVATRDGAQKFDRGQTSTFLNLAGLDASAELLIEIGLDCIYAHNQALVKMFLENYPKSNYDLLTENLGSNIICIQSKKKTAQDLQHDLKQQGIDVSLREGNVRISFHLFNTKDDVLKLLIAI